MRFVTTLVIGLILAVAAHAQTDATDNQWIADGFDGESLQASWNQVAGKWEVAGGNVKAGGAAEQMVMLNGTYIMNTRPYVLEATMNGLGGGVLFNAGCAKALSNVQAVMVREGGVTMGYFDFLGTYVETRYVTYNNVSGPVSIRVFVDPAQRRYSVIIGEKNVALEELRFNSGYSGLISMTPGLTFDAISLTGKGALDTPSYYVKSNKRQLEDLSYMSVMGESLLITNPLVGIVQKLTSVGTYVNEIQPGKEGAALRGVWSDTDESVYVVDAAAKAVHVYNNTFRYKFSCTGDLEDPRGVAVDDATVYVLDKNGIVLFDKKNGKSLGKKAGGLFKDPKNIYVYDGRLLVSDFGNAQVQVLGKADFSVEFAIQEDLVRPWGVCADPTNGDIYVADPGAAAVLHYDASGNFVERIDPLTIRGFVSPRAVLVLNEMVYVGDYDRILGFKKGVLTIRPSLRID